MAEVYRGRVAGAEGFEKLVAIKRVLPEYARDERFISMLLTEARIHSALSHRNIVQIHDLGISEDGEYFIVLEYVEGHDLRAVMEAATALGVQIPDSLALHIAYELAQALHFAHELKDAEGHALGIVHRDVSPSNVLLSNSGEVKLSDFGIAKRQRDHSVVGSLKGNLVYMSPEQARKGPVDRRTDVFSLGAVLFEMLTGQKPREIKNEVDGWREVVSGGVRSARALRPDIPDEYEALLARAMASDPNDRFPDAAIFGAAVRELLRGREAPAGPNDIKELIEVLDPPRHARSPVERSKVIRLGPEFKLPPGLGGTGVGFGAGTGTPFGARPSLPGAPPPIAASMSPALTPPPIREPSATPPPVSPRERTDLGLGRLLRPDVLAAAAASIAGTSSASEPSGMGANAANAGPGGPPTPPPASSGPPPLPIVRPAPRSMAAPPAIVMAPAPSTAPASVNGSGTNGSHGRGYGTAGLATPPLLDAGMPTPPPVVPSAMAPNYRVGMPLDAASAPTPPPLAPESTFSASGPHRSGGVVAPRGGVPFPGSTNQAFSSYPLAGTMSGPVAMPSKSGFGFGKILLVLVVLVAGAAAYVHLKVMPLDLLLVWNKPASLQVASEPSGAEVTLDGRALAGSTPTHVQVKRDRADHVIEVTKTNFVSGRREVRFDRTGDFSETVTLVALPPPPPPPRDEAAEAAKAEAAKAEAAQAEAAKAAEADAKKAEAGKNGKSGKKGKKEKKEKKGKAGKKAKRSKHGK